MIWRFHRHRRNPGLPLKIRSPYIGGFGVKNKVPRVEAGQRNGKTVLQDWKRIGERPTVSDTLARGQLKNEDNQEPARAPELVKPLSCRGPVIFADEDQSAIQTAPTMIQKQFQKCARSTYCRRGDRVESGKKAKWYR
jgi:hypothetical protein